MNKARINFTPGPSQLYFTVEDHMKYAFREGIPSLSHRSKQFDKIFKDTTEGIRALLGVPPNYHIFFTGSATEIWERSIQNLVEFSSFHLVNGSFSKRYFEVARQLNKQSTSIEVKEGKGFDSINVPSDTELIAITHNETSTGVSLPISFIESIRNENPDALIAVDAVSSLPYPKLPYDKLDSVFFSVQKGFGLPAGLGVWMVNERCIEKAERMIAKGISIGSYHNIPTLLQNEKKHQTPETPNVLSIFLLGKVVGDMLAKGIEKIRKETEYKAAILYQTLDKHASLEPFVLQPEFQSKTVIVANTGNATEEITSLLMANGMHPGDGYGSNKKTQLRFANFPTHGKEQFELLCDTLEKF
ncbi:MAG: aminotransferase class V-fold PLP-dependent enzyme [Chryseolinea sp.]